MKKRKKKDQIESIQLPQKTGFVHIIIITVYPSEGSKKYTFLINEERKKI